LLEEKYNQALRDKALHLYGDMLRTALRYQQHSGLETHRLQLFALSVKLHRLMADDNAVEVELFLYNLNDLEFKFNNIDTFVPKEALLTSISKRIDIVHAKVDWWQAQKEEAQQHRLEMHRAAEDLRVLLSNREQANEAWVTAVGDAKQRINHWSEMLAKLDKRASAVSFLGVDLAQANVEAIDAM